MTQQQSNGNSLTVQGRMVWTLGTNMFAGKQKTNMQTKQVIIDQRTGQPVIEYGFGLAIPKIDPTTGKHTEEFVKIWQALHAEAMTLFPSGQIPPTFAMKYKDGDTAVDDQGRPYSTREGYAGHFVVTCTTRLPIKYFIWQGGNNVLVNEGFKCGDYVNVQMNIKAHPAVGTSKAGLYVNPGAVQMIQPGKEIINAPSGDQMFGQNAPAYQGQVIPPQQTMPGQLPPQNAGPLMPPMGQQQQAQQFQPAQPQHDPHYGILPPGHQPPPPGNGQQYGQMPPAMPGTQNQYAQNGSVPYTGQNGMNGMTAPQNAYPSNGMPGMPR